MPRSTVTFVCTECGGETLRWAGQCPHCQAWNTLQEFQVKKAAPARRQEAQSPGRFASGAAHRGVARDRRARPPRLGRAEPRARRRDRPGQPGPGRRRAGRGQVDPADARRAPGRPSGWRGQGPLRLRRGVEPAGAHASGASRRPRSRHPHAGRERPGFDLRGDRGRGAEARHRGFDPDRHRRGDHGQRRQRDPGSRIGRSPDAAGEGDRNSHLPRRPRHERRSDSRTKGPGAYR